MTCSGPISHNDSESRIDLYYKLQKGTTFTNFTISKTLQGSAELLCTFQVSVKKTFTVHKLGT